MSLKTVVFKFEYLSSNGVLEYFLGYYAKRFNMQFAMQKSGKNLSFFVSGSEDELLKFSDNAMINIPNSIFLSRSSVEIYEDELPNSSYQISNLKFNNITPSVVKSYIKKDFVENEFGILSEICILKQDENLGESLLNITKENFSKTLDELKLKLLHNQPVSLKCGDSSLKLVASIDFKASYLMPTSALNISKIFVAKDEELIILNSYEKPILNLRISNVFRKNSTEIPTYFDIKMADDLFLFALLNSLKDDGIDFVSIFSDCKEETKVSVLKDRVLILKSDKFNQILYPQAQKPKDYLQISLNKKGDDEISLIHIESKIPLLKLRIPLSFDEIYAEIKSDEVGSKLLDNFTKEFELARGELKQDNSFCALFDLISKVIFDKDANYLLECAKNSLASKGPLVDFKGGFDEPFNISKTLRSAMSYKLAGVDDNTLSLGCIESLAYFLTGEIAKIEASFKEIYIDGDLLENQRFIGAFLELIDKKFQIKLPYENI
ncbi:MAG: hypothetical protein MR902_01640 [Campylobacter sp.]|nr:hypothetical protein [Campylobacter sp.]